MEIQNINSEIAFCEAKGLGKVFAAYAANCASETIMEVGFNPNSGYVYIALENGISVCSMLGNDCEYLTTDWNDGEETFYDTYKEALQHEYT